MSYRTGSHTVFHHRYHIVWAPKYRYKVLTREMRLRIREITRQICEQLGVEIIKGVLSQDHVHMSVENAVNTLANMYENANQGEKALSIHLFGIKYADQIRDIPSKEIAIRAGLKEPYGTEIRKGINLAKYVKEKL
jgi:REP element-mobilizing transposase RayT